MVIVPLCQVDTRPCSLVLHAAVVDIGARVVDGARRREVTVPETPPSVTPMPYGQGWPVARPANVTSVDGAAGEVGAVM
jgi:hypothetical protein